MENKTVKIIQHGRGYKRLTFKCKCGCVFETTDFSIDNGYPWSPERTYYTSCPECRNIASIPIHDEMDDIDNAPTVDGLVGVKEMKAEIKPIETEYKGYRFRSRLEARWAVFFDAIGAEWEYEPEGFELYDGTRYLPDFLLHNVRGRGKEDIYVEIKGVLSQDDLHKIELFPEPIIIFGQIPDVEFEEGYYNGEPYVLWSFDFRKDGNENFYNLKYSEGDYYWTEPKAGKGGGLVLDYPDNRYDCVDDNLTAYAYKKARQARFEYGEHGGAK